MKNTFNNAYGIPVIVTANYGIIERYMIKIPFTYYEVVAYLGEDRSYVQVNNFPTREQALTYINKKEADREMDKLLGEIR